MANLAISRRRMVVPVYKRWEANYVRVQVLRQDKIVQMVAFFKDFHHGACMNFVLKETDVFEISSRSGGFNLRMVDAKFALPKGEEDMSKDFVCLDVPEYPGEHDDITITFNNEDGKKSYVSLIPFGWMLKTPQNVQDLPASCLQLSTRGQGWVHSGDKGYQCGFLCWMWFIITVLFPQTCLCVSYRMQYADTPRSNHKRRDLNLTSTHI